MTDPTPGDFETQLRRLAETAIASATTSADRDLICALARTVRTEAASTDPGDARVPARQRALAQAIGSVPTDDLGRTIADLRLFARLSLAECALLLAQDREQLARRWRVIRTLIFTRARHGDARCTKKPPR